MFLKSLLEQMASCAQLSSIVQRHCRTQAQTCLDAEAGCMNVLAKRYRPVSSPGSKNRGGAGGGGLPPHFDNQHLFGPVVLSLTLEGEAQLDMVHSQTGSVSRFTLLPGTLYAMTGRARYKTSSDGLPGWMHGLPLPSREGATRRTSLVFRTLRQVKQGRAPPH